MSLEKNEPCGCGCNCGGDTEKEIKLENAKFNASGVKILGSGCPKCNQLEAAAKEALRQLGMSDAVEHVTDFAKIASYGVMSTPALVIGGKVVSSGKVLKTNEIVALLQKSKS